jgi:hypothetical protein
MSIETSSEDAASMPLAFPPGVSPRTLPDILSAADVATLQTLWLDALREVS